MAGSHRAAGFGRFGQEYWKRANAETPPTDLSAALGHVGDPKHPEVQEAIAEIEAAAREAGIALGTICRSWEEARSLYARGYQMVTLCSDAGLVTHGAAAMVSAFRKEVRPNTV
jgi:2-dehydro-3-deoxyglucarate aldolase